MIRKTDERIIPGKFKSKEEYLVYLRHLFAYEFAEKKFPQNCHVLEVGFGEGYGTNILSKSVKVATITGIDVDLNSTKNASSKYKSDKLSYKHFNGEKIPFKDNYFDTVVSFQVIEHIQNDVNYIYEIYRVLKSGGIFILTTPNRTYRLRSGQKPWNKFHIREYNSTTLRETLNSKFKDLQVLGIRGIKEVQKIELGRVKINSKLTSTLLINFKKIIPTSIKLFIKKIIRRSVRKETQVKKDSLSQYSIEQFYTIKDNLDNSLDLLGVCRKP